MVSMRQKLSREQAANRAIPGVRVKPATEANRIYVQHPTGLKFRASVNDSVEWPNDAFTKRRIRDGSVIKVDTPAAREVVAVEAAPKRKRFGSETA